MAKSWLKAKSFKMKKYRERSRGIMKKWSQGTINVGRTPNAEVMSWYKNSAKSMLINPDPQKLWDYNGNEPRQEALELRDKIMNACPEWRYFRLIEDEWLRARMYFQLSPERCCVLEFNPRTRRSRRSIVYRSRDVAYQRWCEGTIDWVEPDSFHHPHIPETFREV